MNSNIIKYLLITFIVVFISVFTFNQFDFTSIKRAKKPDIKELILQRNNYQNEYAEIDAEIEAEKILYEINQQLGVDDKLDIDDNKIRRKYILKDSIEILNVMINNYHF